MANVNLKKVLLFVGLTFLLSYALVILYLALGTFILTRLLVSKMPSLIDQLNRTFNAR